MKKTAIFILCILVIYLAVSYRQAQIRQLGEEFVTHAYYGELLETKESLENGAALDYVLYLKDPQRQYDGVYFNVLQAAASGGNEQIISYLLKQEMDINTRTPQGWTPLIIAVRDGQTTAAKALIYYKADLNAQTDLGATALMMAVTQEFSSEKEREELLVYMLKRGANPNLTNAFHMEDAVITPEVFSEAVLFFLLPVLIVVESSFPVDAAHFVLEQIKIFSKARITQ